MQIKFSKYQGTGNDFILIDNRDKGVVLSEAQIKWLCDRRFGIGADGLILLQLQSNHDFEMIYFNSDGRPSSMCGNGGRCISAFAAQLQLIQEKGIMKFLAVDGSHEARLVERMSNGFRVDLKMQDVPKVEIRAGDVCILNTGSPHWVKLMKGIDDVNLVEEARKIRYSKEFKAEGINVNFIDAIDSGIKVRTYERGVEDETFSCGTGVVASAISFFEFTGVVPEKIVTKGGELQVSFEKNESGIFNQIHLIGPAVYVYQGEIEIANI